MNLDAIISNYIDDNARFVVITRANYYIPEFLEQRKNVLYFACQGSRKSPYKVKIQFESRSKLKTSCSCPYDGHGICKHQVAALEQVRDIDINDIQINLDLLFPMVKPLQKEPIILKHFDGKIDSEALGKIQFSIREYNFGEIKIKTVTKDKISSVFDSYSRNYKQVLKFDKQRDEISLSCTCNYSKNCFHKYLFLQQFKDNFGLDYFHKDFKKRIQDNILEENNLKGKIDFDEIFSLEISKDGVTYSEKIANIVSTPQIIFSPLDEAEIKPLYQPSETLNKQQYGLGFCIQFFDNKLYELFPFFGKLNKQGTAISSQTKALDRNTLMEAMQKLRQEDLSMVSESIALTKNFTSIQRPTDYRSLADYAQTFGQFLKVFKNTIYRHNYDDNFAKKYLQEVIVSDKKIQPLLEIKENGKFYQLEFKLNIEENSFTLNSPEIQINVCGVFVGNTLNPVHKVDTLIALLKLKHDPIMSVFNHGTEFLKTEIIEPYSKIFDISFKGLTEKTSKKEDFKPIRQVYLSDAEEGEYVVFQPIVKYAEKFVKPGNGEKIWLDEKNLTSLKRYYVFEDDFLLYIQNLHPEFYNKNDYFFIKTEQALESLWLIETIEQFKDKDIQVFGLKDLKKMKYNLHKPSFSTRLSSGTDWFDMKVDIEFGDQKVDLRKLQKAIIKNSNYVELSDGSLGIIPQQWIEKYQKYFKLGQIKKDHIEISNYNFNIIDELYEDLDNSPDFLKELHARRNRIHNLTDLKSITPSKNLNAKLRPYQKDGLNWMVFLHENKLGGCLADDMGLGKTLQSIAFLQYLKDLKTSKNNGPSLVVSPTSLIFNWINEFDKFAPKLNILTFTGTQREELKDKFSEVDVVMTTYGSLIKDIEFHRKQSYNYVILDESQAIKNPSSQRFKAVRLLKAYNRLALTGTPIENNTFDLYSQFNFLNPGIFGSVKHFRTTFSDAIDKEQDEYTSALLAKMIKPFILRRTKSQVAKELPNKTESVIYCEMGKQQRKVYDNFKAYYREKLNEQIEKEGINRSQVYILQGLTKLRQICNSTALADKDKDYGNFSTKLDELTRHITEKVNNHKVLVFSQFVGMLDLVKKRLDDERIIYEYLDGKTKDRESKVNRFQNDDDVRVFLISLKAGGTGLNLTKAEYVYLIDPWWNPAVENQAIDRCYRIGQDNHVFAYRMICKDTIEERIVELQNKKKSVASEVIRTDIDNLPGRPAGKSFDKKDLEKLFGL